MSWTNDDLAAIETAIKGGVTTVSYRDRTVTYRSVDELVRIRNLMRGDLGLTAGENGRTHRYAETSKGL